MKVKATFSHDGGFGYYDNQRRFDGAVFVLQDPKHFSEKWMIKLDEEAQAPKRKRRTKQEMLEDEMQQAEEGNEG